MFLCALCVATKRQVLCALWVGQLCATLFDASGTDAQLTVACRHETIFQSRKFCALVSTKKTKPPSWAFVFIAWTLYSAAVED